ncbi:unnamed protein product [Clonostachys byssicola]|uniref:Uncharacterized protein n=1 Tax=Clonostachys byssicola TaxID=160290 RepID=A0A9N9UVC4_9HYPO|nr:unnamed protein product [Clonostachys byssicola]
MALGNDSLCCKWSIAPLIFNLMDRVPSWLAHLGPQCLFPRRTYGVIRVGDQENVMAQSQDVTARTLAR